MIDAFEVRPMMDRCTLDSWSAARVAVLDDDIVGCFNRSRKEQAKTAFEYSDIDEDRYPWLSYNIEFDEEKFERDYSYKDYLADTAPLGKQVVQDAMHNERLLRELASEFLSPQEYVNYTRALKNELMCVKIKVRDDV